MIPVHMNLIDVQILLIAKKGRILAKDRPRIDPDYRRPRGKKRYEGTNKKSVLNVRAQVFFTRQEEKDPGDIGDAPRTDGRLTMRKRDFDGLEIKPEKGDIIINISEDPTDRYEIVEIRRSGFLRGKPNLIQIPFNRSLEHIGNP